VTRCRGGENMGRKKSKEDHLNDATYLMFYNRLRDLALSLFEWKGLPKEISKRFLELTILYQGAAVFFKDEDIGGYMALPVTQAGPLNVYQDPVEFTAFSINYHKELNKDNAVIIWNNYARESIDSILRNFAYRLYMVERAMDVNISQQKFPIVFLTEESQRLTMENLMDQFEGNHPFVMGNKRGLDLDSVKAITTGVPFVADKLMEYKHNLWNEAMTFLGIGNAKQDKRERLVADEVAANDEQIESSRFIMLKARQEACEKINALFGLSVSVDYKLNILQQEETESEGEKDNEES
jgi:hypothetical protein